jgi:hypothetical protein
MRHVRKLAPISAVALTFAVVSTSACLDRPVSVEKPTTKSSVLIAARQGAVDKIDLLFMIDNSASMADKQDILAEAVPDLITSLVTPACVGDDGKPNGKRANPSGGEGQECANGTPEFRPVTDIHVGIVSSSMGGFGGDQCADPNKPFERDGAHLVARGPRGATIAGVGSSNFLAWLPGLPQNKDKPRLPGAPPITDLEVLKKSASELVKGVGDTGCGLEAQLESVYHFLNEPNPYQDLTLVGPNKNQASLVGLDGVLLEQRADFLRPDSLVAVIMLTDEDDSQVNPMVFGGAGHYWARATGVYGNKDAGRSTSRGTQACSQAPSSDACLPCFDSKAKGDPACAENDGFYKPADDSLNVRFHKMKARFGVDPQYPLDRYVKGFSSTKVPNRDGTKTCQNPLFAASLPRGVSDPNDPRLCDLPAGKRSADRVFFAILGGVPGDLLHFDPNDPKKSLLTDADWDKLVGKDPDAYARDEGVDPRMVQSTNPRAGRPAASKTSGDNFEGDAVRDWETSKLDLQYACTFPLKTERDCSNPKECDCNSDTTNPSPNPPLCGPTGKTQRFAKAYPTPRELRVARSLGKQGIASTLCPLSLDSTLADGAPNPLYGYRPAVSTIVERLKGAFLSECLPEKLTRDASGEVLCIALHSLPEKGAKCEDTPGLTPADVELKASFLERKKKSGDASFEGKTICRATQIRTKPGETCIKSDQAGFCYVENSGDQKPLTSCSQAIEFSRRGTPRDGMTTDLLCIQQSQLAE